MRIGLGPWGADLDELVVASVAAGEAGLDAVWMSELHRTPFVPLAAVAARTDDVRLGTGVALAFLRSPLTLALEALDLDEMSQGRLVLGLGSGVQRLNQNWHNVHPGKPAPHLREVVELVRLLWQEIDSGRPISYEGEWERISLVGYQRPFSSIRRRIPIYLAAVGPVMTRLAGQVGDGWIAHELGSPAYLSEVVMPNLEAGLGKSGRSRADLEIVASACCVVHPDPSEARRRMAGLVAFYASVRTYTDFFAWHGFGEEARLIQERFRANDKAGMLAAVSDEMIDTLTLAGTRDQVRGRLRRYEGVADQVKLSPPTHYVDEVVTREAQNSILELFAV